ncbi:MAG TPA: DMT family transporter [Saprospiraceae bacterium]|nr:DMT family transporter [Saprospiraceae bacterium]
MVQEEQQQDWKAWITLAILALVWGSSFILIKKTLVTYNAVETGSLRIFIAFLGLSPLLMRQIKKIPWHKWKYLLIVCLAGTGFPVFLFANAQTVLPSSLTGILNSTVPIFTLLLGLLVFRVPMRTNAVIGVLVGFAGATLILTGGDQGIAVDKNALYGVLVLLAAFCYATSMNTIKRHLNEVDSISIASSTFLLLGPLTGIYLFGFSEVPTKTIEVQGAWRSLAAVSLLAIVGTFLAKIIFFKLVQRTDAVFSSMVTYMIPIVALFWGWLDGEQIVWLHLLGMALILMAVYLVRKRQRKKTQKVQPGQEVAPANN